ncbi:hypothetical protein K474DRAFT_1670164 [Panus rudis PR-1116 ss-1]|nr:hypothetical protein K474DRAFT_1670164 [Panus rudis PR-1116 ss-1]
MITLSILGKFPSDTRLHHERSTSTLSVSSVALVAYDTVLTFPQEVRCIWQRKWTGATLLYATIRYVTLLNMAIEVAGGLFVPGNTLVCCPIHDGMMDG